MAIIFWNISVFGQKNMEDIFKGRLLRDLGVPEVTFISDRRRINWLPLVGGSYAGICDRCWS